MQPIAYLAGPLGFSEAGRLFYYDRFLPMIERVGFTVLDPWKLTGSALIASAQKMPEGQGQRARWIEVNKIIGANNRDAIKRSDIIVAILDGSDVDSGTASEVGYGAGLGKIIEGYRNDFRLSADNIGSTVNLQVEFFISESGGVISVTLEELQAVLRKRFETLHK